MTHHFGRSTLTDRQRSALHQAVRIEWMSVLFLSLAITMVYFVMGSSQAMKAAWIEDLLSLVPPLAFLLAIRIVRRAPTPKYPYGFHRAVGVAHLVAAVALAAMGLYLGIDSVIGLTSGEHPPIGSVTLWGHTLWLGWLMMIAMALTIPLPIYFGRVKMRLARELHDKVLYADADMNKADWMTAVGSIVGVAGIGVGLWWADAAAALFIAVSILFDGVKNLKASITDLMDTRATTFDDSRPHPVVAQVDQYLRDLPWIADAGSRVRDQGHVFHVESFIIPVDGRSVSPTQLSVARDACAALDWKLEDLVIIPTARLPQEVLGNEMSQRVTHTSTPTSDER